jgi:hypothetical protein
MAQQKVNTLRSSAQQSVVDAAREHYRTRAQRRTGSSRDNATTYTNGGKRRDGHDTLTLRALNSGAYGIAEAKVGPLVVRP